LAAAAVAACACHLGHHRRLRLVEYALVLAAVLAVMVPQVAMCVVMHGSNLTSPQDRGSSQEVCLSAQELENKSRVWSVYVVEMRFKSLELQTALL
jgi:hypothetical protein